MITVKAIFGEDAVKEFETTGQIPSDKWLMDNGGIVDERTFRTQEEYKAYMEGVNDTAEWSGSYFFKLEITPDSNTPAPSFAKRISTLRNEIRASIIAALEDNNLTELNISDATDPTYVIWYDNDNDPHEGQALEICYDGKELSLKVENEGAPITIYEDDPAFESLKWLDSIHDNVQEALTA